MVDKLFCIYFNWLITFKVAVFSKWLLQVFNVSMCWRITLALCLYCRHTFSGITSRSRSWIYWSISSSIHTPMWKIGSNFLGTGVCEDDRLTSGLDKFNQSPLVLYEIALKFLALLLTHHWYDIIGQQSCPNRAICICDFMILFRFNDLNVICRIKVIFYTHPPTFTQGVAIDSTLPTIQRLCQRTRGFGMRFCILS